LLKKELADVCFETAVRFHERRLSMNKVFLKAMDPSKRRRFELLGKLTDDDVTQIQGDTEKMVGNYRTIWLCPRTSAQGVNDFLNAPEGHGAVPRKSARTVHAPRIVRVGAWTPSEKKGK